MSVRTERTPIEPELVGTSVGSRHAGFLPAFYKMASREFGAFAAMIADVGLVEDLTAMEELIVAIEEQICYPRNISVMQLFSIWANMERIDA